MARRVMLPVVGSLAATLLFVVLLRVHPDVAHAARGIDDIGELLAAAVGCAAAGWRACRVADRTRLSWALLSGACGAWAVGEAIWSYYELVAQRETPFPSLADAGYLSFSGLAVIALLCWPSAALRGAARWRALLDGSLVAGSLFIVSWVTALGQTVHAGGDSALGWSVALAYPIGDLVLITLAVVVAVNSRSSLRSGLGLLTVALGCLCVADSGFAYLTATGHYATGNPVDIGWFGGFLLIAAAASSANAENTSPTGGLARAESSAELASTTELGSTAKTLLPYIPVILGLAVAAADQLFGHHDTVVLSAAIVVITVLLGRQLLVVLDNRTLLTQVLRSQHELRHQAFHDPLTGLANRALFADRLHHGLALHQRDLRPVVLLYLDLDGFKQVNDRYGHDTGDQVIKAAAERLRAVTRIGDTVARMGGDEFAILLEDGADSTTVAIHILDAFAQPASINGHPIVMATSIGIAELHPSDPAVAAETLLTRADTAMYHAKSTGKGTAVTWHHQLQHPPTPELAQPVPR